MAETDAKKVAAGTLVASVLSLASLYWPPLVEVLAVMGGPEVVIGSIFGTTIAIVSGITKPGRMVVNLFKRWF